MKSKERAKLIGEVFTPATTVRQMQEHFTSEAWSENQTFMDPAAGNGNILIEVLDRKLKSGSNPIKALATIYGVEILDDNVQELRKRLLISIKKHGGDLNVASIIIKTNIVWANSLEYDFKFSPEDNRAQTSRLTAKDL